MNISRVGVGLWSGAESMGYDLTSDFVSITIADLGAHLASAVMRLDGDQELEVTVGYPRDSADGRGSHGASVGRYANRIAGARFSLDGADFELAANEGPHQLHGGPEGFASHAWSADAEVVGDTGRVELRHKSKDGDQGFPGTVKATASFELIENRITIEYRATADAPTPVNLTNHAYWNLAGPGTLDGHSLRIAATEYVEVDDEKIPVPGPPAPVRGSRFNCNDGRELTSIVADGGYDHCFVVEPDADVHATLRHTSGRSLDVLTDQVGLQVYTGQHLDPTIRGIALETQALPDTPNRPDLGNVTVRPGDVYLARTQFTLKV